MVTKTPICPDRIRKVPRQFSWLDGRLVRDRHLDQCSHCGAALYLFLVTVSDAQGLSYYSDKTLCRRLRMEEFLLGQTRHELIQLGLISYRKPLYQVLDLTPKPAKPVVLTQRSHPEDDMRPFGQILRTIMEANDHD